jgi:hypothetical protein
VADWAASGQPPDDSRRGGRQRFRANPSGGLAGDSEMFWEHLGPTALSASQVRSGHLPDQPGGIGVIKSGGHHYLPPHLAREVVSIHVVNALALALLEMDCPLVLYRDLGQPICEVGGGEPFPSLIENLDTVSECLEPCRVKTQSRAGLGG